MGDPVDNLGRAAEAYIKATGEDDKSSAAAFDYTLKTLGRALREGALAGPERDRLLGEWADIKTARGNGPDRPGGEDLFRLRQEQRDFADAALYFASNPEEMAAQTLRIVTPIPVPEGAAHLEHVMLDTGRYTLRVNKDETIRVFDKATGEVQVLVAGEGLNLRPATNPGLNYFALQDKTYIRFDGDSVTVSVNAPPEDESAPQISFPILHERPEGDRVLILDYRESGLAGQDGGEGVE